MGTPTFLLFALGFVLLLLRKLGSKQLFSDLHLFICRDVVCEGNHWVFQFEKRNQFLKQKVSFLCKVLEV